MGGEFINLSASPALPCGLAQAEFIHERDGFYQASVKKALYALRVFAGIEAIVGTLAPASYIVIHEVRADAWGYQGQTQEFRYVRGKAI